MQDILDLIYSTWQSLIGILQDFVVYLLDKAFVLFLDSIIWLSNVAFGLVLSIFTGLPYDDQINTYASQLHPTFGYVFDALNIATYIQIIIAAHLTRLILGFTIPFFK